ncbi:hypothetical protein PR048_024593 [Dryococelus australis]|uniref:Uncharacterized protein n=1 Tax=Dryococelus australis TaxID=614101 RepID=A0ABQ9GP22_9NEOP|nr:hypothetical protein PR048_024593 [Dryococelus australis]
MKGGGTGDPRENPSTNGIIWHDSHMRKSGVTRTGIEPGSPWQAKEVRQKDVSNDSRDCVRDEDPRTSINFSRRDRVASPPSCRPLADRE